MDVSVFSFGFKHGIPAEVDLMIDVRFLPNPFYDPEMRTLTGNDKKVTDFVLKNPTTQEFTKAWIALHRRETRAVRYEEARALIVVGLPGSGFGGHPKGESMELVEGKALPGVEALLDA